MFGSSIVPFTNEGNCNSDIYVYANRLYNCPEYCIYVNRRGSCQPYVSHLYTIQSQRIKYRKSYIHTYMRTYLSLYVSVYLHSQIIRREDPQGQSMPDEQAKQSTYGLQAHNLHRKPVLPLRPKPHQP